MSATENKELLRRIFAALDEGDGRPFVEAMDDRFRWTITGSSRWSRTWDGKMAVLGELFPALRARIDGRIRTTAHRFVAEGDLVVVEARGSNRTRDGKRYDNAYCYVFRVAGGKLLELTEYMDTELAGSALGDPP
ncbi:MAG TPA: nuclear transport factor 2 family protein [Anaeromyxobacter sp.]